MKNHRKPVVRWSRVLWVALVLLVPLVAGLALLGMGRYSDGRRQAALDLERLGSDVNALSADMGWAIAQHAPRQEVEPAIRVHQATVAMDLGSLHADTASGVGVTDVESAAAAFTDGFSAALARLDDQGIDLSAVRGTRVQQDALMALIDRRTLALTRQADGAAGLETGGTLLVVVLMAAALVVGLWQVEIRRRRVSIGEAQRATLEESERTFRLLFERNPVPMWTYDPATLGFLSVNDATVAAYGYSRDEFLSMSILEIRPEGDREAFLATPRLSTRQLTTLSVAHLRKDGRVIDVDLIADEVGTGAARVRLVAARDITDQRRLEAELHDRAFHDSLTGLANRALFADRFGHAQAAGSRSTRGIAVVLIDLDGFKVVNDTLSHGAGDELLRHVARQLTGAARPQDTVARMGGDEFGVLLEDVDRPTTVAVVTRLLAALGEPVEIDGTAVEVTGSAGVTLVGRAHVTWDTVLRRADVAMYVAKAEGKTEGKARFRVYDAGMRRLSLERQAITAELKRAIVHDELVLHYQPVVSMATGAIVGVEALVRWMHPERGLIQPGDFIGVAEETGLIIPLGAWVMETACRQRKAWDPCIPPDTPFYLSVNASFRELREPGFVPSVLAALASTGMDPRQLVLEVTESVLVENVDRACVRLGQLRQAGIRVAMDDFGAGYASLGYLRDLPLDVVKIDRMFIAGLASSDEDRSMALAIVRLLGTTQAGLVAEGIETEEQLAYVQALGVDWGQGYYFSRPVPADAIPEMLQGPPFAVPRSSRPVGSRAARAHAEAIGAVSRTWSWRDVRP